MFNNVVELLKCTFLFVHFFSCLFKRHANQVLQKGNLLFLYDQNSGIDERGFFHNYTISDRFISFG